MSLVAAGNPIRLMAVIILVGHDYMMMYSFDRFAEQIRASGCLLWLAESRDEEPSQRQQGAGHGPRGDWSPWLLMR